MPPRPGRARRERMAQVLDLAEAGASYRAIGARLGISHTQARADHRDALREVTLPLAEEIRKVHHARYEQLYLMAYSKAKRDSDTRAMHAALQALAQQGRMYGTDVPTGESGVATVRALLDRLLED